MVHKKYITRGGKVYGPYYYESYRVGDKVKKRYFTEEQYNAQHKNNFSFDFSRVMPVLYVVLALLAVAGAITLLLYNVQLQPTGKISLGLETSYQSGESLSGVLKFNLKQGELIPSNSRVVVSLGSQQKEFLLSDLIVNTPISSGDFFADSSSLTGSGEGYGIMGSRVNYPDVDFEIRVITATDIPDESSPGETPAENPAPEEPPVGSPAENPAPEVPSEETPAETPSESAPEGESAPITGNAISESEEIVSGSVSYGEDYIYNLNDGQSAEIVSGSVKVDGNEIGDGEISLDASGGEARVSTDYSSVEEGFGEGYLGSELLNLNVDISELGLNAESGELSVQLIYDDSVLASTSAGIDISGEDAGGAVVEPVNAVNESEPEANITLNESVIANLTSNFTVEENATLQNVSIVTSRSEIRIGQPVRWMKNVSLENPESITIEIPAEAEGIVVKKITGDVEEEISVVNGITGSVISGKVSAEIELSNESAFVKWIKKLFRTITGRAITDVPVELVTSDASDNVELLINDNAVNYIIEYSTEAPQAIEESTSYGKRVVVSGPDNLNYTDIVTFANVAEKIRVGQESGIRVKWVEQNSFVPFEASDSDGNGMIDYVEWITPHLSNQTFEIILISKAEHLDEGRTFVEDVYEQVKERDYNYSAIPAGHYIRVTFERALDSTKDITIYARSNGSGSVGVYEKDGTSEIANFGTIGDDGEYKIYLTNLAGEQDTFDLKIAGGDVEFDYVVDPSTPGNINTCQVLDVPGVYNLTQNLDATGTCFNITTSNVTLDGKGFGITGNSTGYGIAVIVQWNATIKNFAYVNNFSSGVYLFGANRSRVSNITVANNSNGIYLYAGINDTFSNVIANMNFGYGAYVAYCSNSTFANLTMNGNDEGILFQGGMNNTISRLIANDNPGGNGIYLSGLSNSRFSNVTANNNNQSGVRISTSDRNIFSNVTANNNTHVNAPINTGAGIWMTGSSNNSLSRLVVNNNVQFGIAALSAPNTNNSLSNAVVRNNSVGFYLRASRNTNITNMTLANSGAYDLYVFDAANNVTSFMDSYIENYSIASLGSLISFESSDYGEINFLEPISGAGINLSNDVRIGNNSVYVNSSQSGLNASANITLYGLSTDYTYPIMFRDGAACPSTICVNRTSLRVGTVVFNVTGWSNYSIDEEVLVCRELNQSNREYRLAQNLQSDGTCFNATASDIVLDGANFNLTGNMTGFGVVAMGRKNVTIKNFGLISNFSQGIYMSITNKSTLVNLTLRNNTDGINVETFSLNNSFSRIVSSNNSRYGLRLFTYCHDSNFSNVTMNSNNAGLYASNSDRCTFTNLTANSNSNGLILQSNMNNGTFSGITAIDNFGDGFSINSKSNGNKITNFVSYLNSYGLSISFSNNTVLTNANITLNSIGIMLEANSSLNNFTNVTSIGAGPSAANPDFYILNEGCDYNYLIDSYFNKYNFGSYGSIMYFRNSSAGEIKFLSQLTTSSTQTNLSNDIKISDNFVYVNSSKAGLNHTANITLYDVPPIYSFPAIYRDGELCPSTICKNRTSLSGAVVIFNVTGWSNYTIGGTENDTTKCGLLNIDNGIYVLSQNIRANGTCFNITASNVTLDGNGFNLTGNITGSGVASARELNITIKNFGKISNFTNGIYFIGVNRSTISNVTSNNHTFYGAYLLFSFNNDLTKVTTNGNNNIGIYIQGGGSNRLSEITANSNNVGINYDGSSNNNLSGAVTNNNDINGVFIFISNRNSVSNVTANNNLDAGIYLYWLSANNTFSNIVSNNNLNGLHIFSPTALECIRNNFTNMTSIGSTGQDIRFTGNGSNYTYLIDSYFGSYNISNLGSIIYFKDEVDGEIKFLNLINGTGTNLSSDVRIGNNSVYVNSSQKGLNVSANITLEGITTTFFYPTIFKDGEICLPPNCVNRTVLEGSAVFNVTGWSNYSIAEGWNETDACGNLNLNNRIYRLTNNVVATLMPTDACFNISGHNVTLDGRGFGVLGNTSGYGVLARGKNNVTVTNLTRMDNFSMGVWFIGTNRSTISYVTASKNIQRGVYLSSFSINNTLSYISASESASNAGIQVDQGSRNVIMNVNSTGNLYGIVFSTSQNITLSNATVRGNNYGFYITDSPSINLTNVSATGSSNYDLYTAVGSNMNNTRIIDSYFESYLLDQPALMYFARSGMGEVKFLRVISGSGTNLSGDIMIAPNLVYVNSSQTGFNKSANITLYNVPTSFARAAILRDGYNCSRAVCYNFTSLSAPVVMFNVSEFSNYTIGEYINGIPAISIVFANSTSASNFSIENLTCWANGTDSDNDSLSYNGRWYRNGVPNITFDTAPTNSTPANLVNVSTLNTSYLFYGDNWSCYVRAYDGYNNSAYAASGNLTIGIMVSVAPQNGTYTNLSNVNFTINITHNIGLTNATLNIYNLTGLYNRTTINLGGVLQSSIGIVVWLADGVYNWFWEIVDAANILINSQTTTGNQTIIEDTAKSTVTFVPPTETTSSYYHRTNIVVNVSVTEINFANVTVYLYNSTGLWNSTANSSNPAFFNFTSLPNGVYWFNATAYDKAGNFNHSETRNVSIGNTVPTHGTPMLNSTSGKNYTSDNLTAYNMSSSDLEGDYVKNIITWNRNGSLFTIFNMPFENNGSGNGTIDYADGNNITQFAGNVFWNATGGYDGRGAYIFDGNGDYLNLTSMINLSDNSPWTISYWFYHSLAASNDMSFGRSTGIASFIQHTTGSAIRVYNDVSNDVTFNLPGDSRGAWHHLAITANGHNSNNVRLYYDGALTQVNTLANAQFLINSIGRDSTAANDWSGRLDDIMIFNDSLVSEQIWRLANNRTDVIAPEHTRVGQVWKACITPNDGYADGVKACSNDLIILTQAPTQGTPILNSSSGINTTGENLTVYNQSTSDPNAGSVRNIVNWYRNGSSILSLNMPFEREDYTELFAVKDYSPYSNNGTVIDAAWNRTGGYDGNGAYEFDGTGDYLNLTSIINLSDNAPWTISYWFYQSLASTNDMPFGRTTGVVNNYIRHTTGSVVTFLGSTGATPVSFTLGGDSRGAWHHIAVTANGQNTNNVRLYYDGALTQVNTFADTQFLINSIGRDTTGTEYWTGALDDVRVYNNTNLSVQQISVLYNNRSDLIVSQELAAGVVWKACIIPHDGIESGNEVCSNNLTVVESARTPVMASVFANSTTGMNYTDEDLTCWARATDGDGDNVSYSGNWYKNGAVNLSFNTYPGNYTQGTTVNVSTLDKSYTLVGENWTCNVSAFDGALNSSYLMSSNVTVTNIIGACGSVSVDTRVGKSLTTTGLCFNITADSIYLDGRGVNITGNRSSHGVYAGGRANVTVKNFALIRNFTNAIYLSSSLNTTLLNLTFGSNANDINLSDAGNNYTWIVDSDIANYSVANPGSLVYFARNNVGEIRFLREISGTGENLSSDVQIATNLAYVNSTKSGLNKDANITLQSVPTNFVRPKVLRDGIKCPSSVCYNFTSLSAGTVVFNVTGFSNYSIGDYFGLNVTQIFVNSTWGMNSTNENLTCWVNGTDENEVNLDYSGYWYKNGTLLVHEMWNKSYNSGSTNWDNSFSSAEVAVDGSGNVYATWSGYGVDSYYTIRYNSLGEHVWNRTYTSTDNDYSQDIAVDSSGNAYVTGSSGPALSSNYYTIKYNSSGDAMWNQTYNGGGDDWASGVAVDSLGDAYVTGYAASHYYTIKYNSSNGATLWAKPYNSGSTYDFAKGIAVDSSGNTYVAGYSGSAGAWTWTTIKYDNTSTQLWLKNFGGGSSDDVYGIAVDSSGNAYVVGYASGYKMVKYNSSGDYLWNKTLADGSRGYGVAVDFAGDVYTAGLSNSNYYTAKYDPSGNLIWNTTYDSGTYDSAKSVAPDIMGNVYVIGGSTLGSPGGNYYYHLKKYNNMFVSSGNVPGALVNVSTIDSSYTELGDNWSCSARAIYGIVLSNYFTSGNLTIRDAGAPNITILEPLNASYNNASNVNFTINVSDSESGLANATLYIYNLTGLYNMTTINLGGALQATVGIVVWLADGVYNWFWEVFDLANNFATTQNTPGNYTVSEDTIKSNVVFVPPTEISGSVHKRTNILVNVSVTDINFANVTINLYNLTSLVNSTTSTSDVLFLNFTGLAGDTYFFNATAYDKAGNFNHSETRNVTVANVAPNITQIFVNSTYGTNLTTENLTCWANGTDADGDLLNYSGSWYRNGLFNNSFSSNYSHASGALVNVSMLNSTYLIYADNWSCSVRAYDSANWSGYATSGNLTIRDRSPSVIFNYKIPADLNLTSFIGPTGINISYNITDEVGLNNNSIKLYYKSNSTQDNIMYYQNGSASSGYFPGNPVQNGTPTYIWTLYDNNVLPGIYNYGEISMENTPHGSINMTANADYLKIEFYNVSSAKRYSFFEIMVNRTAGTGTLRYYYCNSSYTTGNVAVSTNCINFYTQTNNSYNHRHTANSAHMLAPMAINETSGAVGTVKVTQTSYLLIRGITGTTWTYYNITNASRAGAYQTTANSGGAWTSQTYTVDGHLHQFGTNTSLWYYACANDTVNNQNCSAPRQDLFLLAGLSPNAPEVYNPVEGTYIQRQIIFVNYTAAESPNGYPIARYNISLTDTNGTYIRTLETNNSLNLSYAWNTTGTALGGYLIRVEACDNLSQCSYGYSENFTLVNNTLPLIASIFVNSTFGTNLTNENLTCWVNATDFNGQNVSYNGSWYKNGAVNLSFDSAPTKYAQANLTNVSTLSDSYTQKGENWSCNVSAFDGFDYSTYNMSGNLTILNTVPTQGTPILNSTNVLTNYTSENLTVYNTSTFDADSDAVKNIINWRRSNVSVTVLNVPFEGGSNSTWTKDYSGFGNNGSVKNAVWNALGGYDGNGAYVFNGTTAWINVSKTTGPITTATTGVTMMAWIKWNGSTSNYQTVMYNGNSGLNGYGIFVNSTNKFVMMAGGVGFVNTNVAPVAGSWTHVAVVGTGLSWKFYINGAVSATNSNLNPAVPTLGTAIGAALPLASYFNGTIDDVYFLNRSLSAAQIAAIYNNRTDLMVSQELTGGDVWEADITPNDGTGDGTTKRSNNATMIATPGTCGSTITTDFILNNNISCTGNGLIVGTDNITIQCNNTFMNGSRVGIGIDITRFNNVTIKNCTITSFRQGILLNSSNNDTFIYNNISYNYNAAVTSGNGLYAENSSYINFTGNYVGNNMQGIYLSNSSGAYFGNNKILNHSTSASAPLSTGVYLYNSGNSTFVSNVIATTRNSNIQGEYSGYVNIMHNSIENSSNSNGIYLQYGSGHNTIYNNTIYNNAQGTGVILYYQAGNHSNISSNTMLRQRTGIAVSDFAWSTYPFNVTIANNRIDPYGLTAGGWNSIELDGRNYLISGNVLNGNGSAANGIYIYGFIANSTIYNNTIANHTSSAIGFVDTHVYPDASGTRLNISFNNIYGNGISGSTSRGVLHLTALTDSNINNNSIFDNNYYGIVFAFNSQRNNVTGNLVTRNPIGVYWTAQSGYPVLYNVFRYNNLSDNNQFSVLDDGGDCNNSIDITNLGGDGLPIFFRNGTSMTFENANNYSVVYFCDADGSRINNVTVNNRVTKSDGIILTYSDHSTISNSTVTNSYYGIYDYYGYNNTVVNNAIKNSTIAGIYHLKPGETYAYVFDQVRDNLVEYTPTGIYLRGHPTWLTTAYYFNVTGNTIRHSNSSGIYLARVINSTVVNNTIYNSTLYGIVSEWNDNSFVGNNISFTKFDGIYLYRRATVSGNTISYSNRTGISVTYSSSSITNNEIFNTGGSAIDLSYNFDILTDNVINNCTRGIYLSTSSSYSNNLSENYITNATLSGIQLVSGANTNKIYNNYLYNNTADANDSGTGNMWNTTYTCENLSLVGGCMGGNLWTTYYNQKNLTDRTGDGIGDDLLPVNSSYARVGGNVKDYLPLAVIRCGDELTGNTNLTSINNLDSCTSDGLTIVSNNVVLDCNYISLISNGAGYGIHVRRSNSTNITNCIVQNFSTGLYVNRSNYTIAKGNLFLDNSLGANVTAGSEKGWFYSNYFNNTGDNNAYDLGINDWNASTEGNFWSDYNTTHYYSNPSYDYNVSFYGGIPVPQATLGLHNYDYEPRRLTDWFNIRTCGRVITYLDNNKELYLVNNLYCPGQDAIQIRSEEQPFLKPPRNVINVTLNCDGKSITGDGTHSGIISVPDNFLRSSNAYYSDSVIKNCLITNFSTGISFNAHAYAEATWSDGCVYTGAKQYINGILIKDNRIANCTRGISFISDEDWDNYGGFSGWGGCDDYCMAADISDNTLTNNSIKENDVGIYFSNNPASNQDNCGHGAGDEYANVKDNYVTGNIIRGNDLGIFLTRESASDEYPKGNWIYNNLFNNTNNSRALTGSQVNFWNVTRTLLTNIVGGTYLGGNYWSNYFGVDDGSAPGTFAGDYIGDTLLPYNNSANMSNGDWLPLKYLNVAPEMTNAFVNSTYGTNITGENLTCWVSASDEDSSILNYTGYWYKDGVQNESINASGNYAVGLIVNVSTLNESYTLPGENWSCYVRAFDSLAYSDYMTSGNLTIMPKKSDGDVCAAGGQCNSGNCAEGVCCNTGCGSTCESCLADYNGGSNGTCGYITSGDPYNECTDSGWNGCSGSGSPNSCTKTKSSTDSCSGSGASCGTDSASVASGNVCDGGSEATGSDTLYASIDAVFTNCSSAVPTNGFGDKLKSKYSCDGSGGVVGPVAGSEASDCLTGCCFDAGATASCEATGTHNINYWNFGGGDNGVTDYCISSEVKDCYDDTDCLPSYYCNASNGCSLRPVVTLRGPANGATRLNNEDIVFNFSVQHATVISDCKLWGNFSGIWAANQTKTYPAYDNSPVNFDNTLRLTIGSYIWNVQCTGSEGWAANNFTLNIGASNVAPNNPVPSLNSTTGTNKTLENLHCFAAISDPDANGLNVTIMWFKNNTLNQTVDYNNSYANNTAFDATLSNSYTTKGDGWRCGMRLFDGSEYSLWVNSSELIILNSAPTISLTAPADGNVTTNRTPTFSWSGSDADGDGLTYDFNISLVHGVPPSTCSDADKTDSGLGTTYTLPTPLKCLSDNRDSYLWSAKAYDGIDYSSWATYRRINLTSLVAISLPNELVSFGSLGYLKSNDTTTDSPAPFLLQNDGNSLANITVKATDLWNTIANPNQYYKFKIDNSTELNSFYYAGSVTVFTNMSNSVTELMCISELNYVDATDSAEIDIYVEVPYQEGTGARNSDVTFTATLAE